MSQTATGPQAQPPVPPLVVNIQYVKDMSFEVPNAPAIYTQLRAQPQVNINLDVNARRLHDDQHVYEVTLLIRAEAREPVAPGGGNGQAPLAPPAANAGGPGAGAPNPSAAGAPTVFVAELAYAGVFSLNLPNESIEPVLLVECPRILFPFARNILAEVTRDGGFPPVLLQPIDFVALWQSRQQQAPTVAQA